MTSIEIKDFSVTLEKFINEYNLPWEVKRLVVEDICRSVTNRTNNELLEQAKERQSEEKKPRKIFHEDPKPLEKAEE